MFFDATQDRVAPITEALTQYTTVSSIHIVSTQTSRKLPTGTNATQAINPKN